MQKKALILYFSLTSNTKKVAELFIDYLKDYDYKVNVLSIKDATSADIINCDLLGFGAPCHASQLPSPAKKFLKNIPYLYDKRTFVFSTSAGSSGKTLYDMAKLFKKSGGNLLGGLLALGTVTHPASCINGRAKNRPDKRDALRVKEFVESVISDDNEDYDKKEKNQYLQNIKFKLNFYYIVPYFLGDWIKKILLIKPRYKKENCINCGKCITNCPSNNIQLKHDKINIGSKCTRCYNCTSICQQKAITANLFIGNFLIWMFYNKKFVRWFGSLTTKDEI